MRNLRCKAAIAPSSRHRLFPVLSEIAAVRRGWRSMYLFPIHQNARPRLAAWDLLSSCPIVNGIPTSTTRWGRSLLCECWCLSSCHCSPQLVAYLIFNGVTCTISTETIDENLGLWPILGQSGREIKGESAPNSPRFANECVSEGFVIASCTLSVLRSSRRYPHTISEGTRQDDKIFWILVCAAMSVLGLIVAVFVGTRVN